MKQEFLEKWMMGLQACSSSKKNMSIMERKNAIKLAADIAMASSRHRNMCWSRALIANASTDDNNRILIDQISGTRSVRPLKIPPSSNKNCSKRNRCKKILKRSCAVGRVKKGLPGNHRVLATSIAKRLVKRRTQVLKSLVPGGEFMDEVSLIHETLDYIVSLQEQVDVMRCVAASTELVDQN